MVCACSVCCFHVYCLVCFSSIVSYICEAWVTFIMFSDASEAIYTDMEQFQCPQSSISILANLSCGYWFQVIKTKCMLHDLFVPF